MFRGGNNSNQQPETKKYEIMIKDSGETALKIEDYSYKIYPSQVKEEFAITDPMRCSEVRLENAPKYPEIMPKKSMMMSPKLNNQEPNQKSISSQFKSIVNYEDREDPVIVSSCNVSSNSNEKRRNE